MPRLLLLLIFCGFITTTQAQQRLAAARQRSYLTKVFRLTEAQTKLLYERGLGAARPDFFAVPVDSFPTDSLRLRPLPPGYYLVAHTEAAQLVYWLRTETNRTIEVLDNQVDLALVVRDSLGRLLPEARVQLRRRPVPYDAATRTYRRAGRGRAGLVAVTYGGRTTFHALEQPRQELRSAGGRVWRRVVLGWPLGYATGPVRQLARDLRHAANTTTGLVGMLRAPFEEDVRAQRRRARRTHPQRRWGSYVVLSQPRYRPTADTLRLKARVLHRRTGRPYRRPLTLWLSPDEYEPDEPGKRLAELRPVRPGTFEYVLPLTDTLGLRADDEAYLYFKNKRGRLVASRSFRVEDYELDNAHYALRVAEKDQRHGQPQAVYLRGTDANELPLLDARVRLVVMPQREPGPLPRRQVFMPDTLWTHTQALDPVGETRVNLPPGLFPDVDFDYQVRAIFLTADNERHVETARVAYQRDAGRLRLTLSRDSVRLSYDSLGRARPHRATLEIADRAEPGRAAAPPVAVQLPLSVPLDFLADYYRLTDAAGRAATLHLDADNADLGLSSDRSADSVVLAVRNPHRVPFWYFVYRGNALRYRGYGPDYQLRVKDKSPAAWHVSLHYRWGDAVRVAEYTVGAPARQLLVATDQPAVAYPGQKIRLGFTVTDERGRPVPDADLTAYAYTHKFEQPYLPETPNFQRVVAGRQARRRFRLGAQFDAQAAARQPLPWARWRTRLGLDSLRFYQFLYPETGLFAEYQPAPGGLTQVAPFVVDSGRVQAPIAVYVDGQPVYIHAVNEYDPYPMVADSGRHTLSLRLPDRLLTLRNVYLRPRHKLTLSIDLNHPRPDLTVEKRPRVLTPAEQLALGRSIVLVDSPRDPAFTTLRQGQRLRVLRGDGYGLGRRRTGPFRPDSVLLRRADGLRLKFLFEPLYAYTPRPQLLKMVSVEPGRLGYLGSTGLRNPLPLADFALTEAEVRPSLYPAPFEPEAVLDEPTQTPPGQGRLALRLPPRPDTARAKYPLPQLRYVLLTRPDQPKYRRLSRRLWLAALAPGRYRVAALLSDSTCLAPAELAVVRPGGQTYLQLRWADRQPAGALSRRIGRLVRARYVPLTQEPAAPSAQPETPSKLRHLGPAQPDWRTLRGQVLDYKSEAGLPGVTVLVKGTDVGTATDVDGSFTLQVPPGSTTLLASFVGYATEKQNITFGSEVVFKLREDTKSLQEVVVVGYGSVQRRDLTGAVATVQYGLQGRVAGVQITSASGYLNGGIVLRGNRSVTDSAQPLLVVDGRVYTGNLGDISPDNIATTTVLKGADATALYGSRAANGVLVITTKGSPNLSRLTPLPALPTLPDVPTGDPRLALRRRFRDYAWWRPTLVTDAQGRASTEVVLPDDVTSWDTFVIGSDQRRRLGAATRRLRSFKPLLAELAGPRFLVAGDRAQVLGKVLNYRPDTAQVTTTFKVGAQVVRTQAHRVSSSALDTLTVAAPSAGADSVQVTYGLQAAGGYADGEQRSIMVVPAGTRERVGTFAAVTAADTTLTLPLDPKLGPVTVHLESDALPTLRAEIEHLQAYAYLCNEQMASKLLALLLERRICAAQKVAFRNDKAVNFLVRKLRESQRPAEGLWGTWATTAPSYWVSAHVLEALLAASAAGYRADLNRPALQAHLLRELDTRLSVPITAPTAAERRRGLVPRPTPAETDDQLRLLRLLHQLGTPTDYRTYLDRLNRAQPGRRALDHYLASVELRQQLGLPYQLDSLPRYRQRTELGGAFYADTAGRNTYYRYLLPDRVATTLLAYRVLRTQGGHEAELVRIRTFLLGLRGGGYWGSTYEAANILATIGPDLLAAGGAAAPAQVQLRGPAAAEAAGRISKFPFSLQLPAASGPLTLHKTGPLPVYATAYQTRWNPTPEPAAQPFTVSTTLGGQTGRRVSLRAGQPAELLVTVDVRAEARYVLLEVPIPAGCSYGPAPVRSPLEAHRENLRHQVGIFIDYLPSGRHTFRVALQPRYRGQYTLNPARAELVYFPTKYGRAGSKQVGIQ
ncbi:carboxypeptidase-like regulatory domain-containing protein [Hymenobacter bucti]|uniref:Carboxypeptidase-like regulatory domain-containing protein n=1 Tax=Hymenobacter bucti TaxID=1844114 RepID=A0ABW4QY86_9BACT